jgi:hypothetical protein
MLTVVVVLKAVTEIALLALLGQGLLALLAGATAPQNVFYGVLSAMTRPVRRVAGWITPASVTPRMHGFVAFCLLASAWLALTIGKIKLVLGAAPA